MILSNKNTSQHECVKRGKIQSRPLCLNHWRTVVFLISQRQRRGGGDFCKRTVIYTRTVPQPVKRTTFHGNILKRKVCGTLPGQCRSSHVSLYTNGHGNASTADVAQLLWHCHTVAEVEPQASIVCVRQDTKRRHVTPQWADSFCFICANLITDADFLPDLRVWQEETLAFQFHLTWINKHHVAPWATLT